MNRSFVVLLATVLPLACGGDDDDSDDGTLTIANTSGVTASGTAGDDDGADDGSTAAPGDDSTSGGGDDGGMAGPPVIDSISWTHDPACEVNVGSDTSVVVAVTDPDNEASELTFEGMLIGCTGMVDAPMVTLVCPQVAPYTGTVTVTDPDGGSDSLEITIEPCVDGSAM